MKYLLDTNFIIGLHKFDEKVVSFIKKQKIDYQDCAISVITYLEALGFKGLNVSDKVTMEKVLSLFHRIELTKAIQDQTVILRQANKIKLPDAIILATSQVHDLELISFDKKLLKYSGNDDL